MPIEIGGMIFRGKEVKRLRNCLRRTGSYTEEFRRLRAKRNKKKQLEPIKKQKHKNASNVVKPKTPKYSIYIKSKKWIKKRTEALLFYGEKCSICSSESNLIVHHKTYENLGNEPLGDLQILCGGCHCNFHEGEIDGVVDPLTSQFLKLVKQF